MVNNLEDLRMMVWYCRYGDSAGKGDGEGADQKTLVIERDPDGMLDYPPTEAVITTGWKVFDTYEDENGYYNIYLCADDEDGIFEQLTEPEVAVAKNAEGDYVLSIQKESGYDYSYMVMPLGVELEPGVTLTYERAVGMVNGMLEEAFSYKTLYKVFEEAPDGYLYTEAVNLGDTGVVIQVIKYSYVENRWLQTGATALVAGEPSNPTPPAGDTCEHSWVTEKNERGHWATCSVCGTANGSVDYPAAHTDNDSDNKCDVCEYVVYKVALKTNGHTPIIAVYVCDTNDHVFVDDIRDGDTFVVPENCTVKIFTGGEFTVSAPGAEWDVVESEGKVCIVSEFTRNTAIVFNPSSGDVVANEEVDNEAPIQGVEIKNSIDEFVEAKNIFTPEEVDRILTGEDASVRLAVDKIDTVPGEQKTDIEAKAAALGANANITYFDASLFKKVGNDPEQSVSNPGMDIEITIEIPENLINTDSSKTRTYQLLRYHNGEGVSVIDGSFSNGKFTFKTNKFSTYAIIYTDTAVTNPGNGNQGGNSGSTSGSSSSSSSTIYVPTATVTPTVNQQPVKDDVPKTGEGVDYTAMVWTAMLAIGVAGLVLERQKKRQ